MEGAEKGKEFLIHKNDTLYWLERSELKYIIRYSWGHNRLLNSETNGWQKKKKKKKKKKAGRTADQSSEKTADYKTARTAD